MKEQTQTTEHPAYTTSQTIFACEKCEATFMDRDDAREHEVSKHSPKATLGGDLDTDTFEDCMPSEAIYISSEEEFKNYLQITELRKDDHFTGPGWYAPRTRWHACGRCGSSGCGWDSEHLIPLTEIEQNLMVIHREIVTKIRSIRDIKKRNPLC